MIIVTFLDTVVTVDVLTASNNDVMLVRWTKNWILTNLHPVNMLQNTETETKTEQ